MHKLIEDFRYRPEVDGLRSKDSGWRNLTVEVEV
jgi:hypothetical protein